MTHVLECTDCKWHGQPDDLVSDGIHENSIDDFTFCPDCGNDEFEEAYIEEK